MWVFGQNWCPCPNMFNSSTEQQQQQQQSLWTPASHVDPRISFSNDFADIQQPTKHENIYREAPVSSEFEFCAENYNMISADEVFFQGVLLPVPAVKKMTLRDELLSVEDDYENVVFPKMSKNGSRWRERLGLKKGRKYDKTDHHHRDQVLETVVEEKMPAFVHEEEVFVSKKTQVINWKYIVELMENIEFIYTHNC